VRGEVARSRSLTPTLAGGEARFEGNAQKVEVEFQSPLGWRATTTYRRVEATFLAPAAQTLANNLRGWEATVSGPLSRSLALNLNYSRQLNAGGAVMPEGKNKNLGIQLDLRLPRFIPLGKVE